MARIPIVTATEDARVGRTNNFTPNTRASGEAFGAGIGRALGAVASGLDSVASGIDAYAQRKRQETVANQVAQSDFTSRELAIRNEVPASGEGYHQRVTEEYDAYVDQQAEAIEDDVARAEYKNRMRALKPSISSRSAQYEFTLQAEHSKAQADASLTTLNNKIMSDPTMYDNYVQQGLDVIDTRPNVTAALKEGMKQEWRQNSAKNRFMGMLEKVTTVEQVDAIAAELTGEGAAATGPDERPKDWTKEFKPEDYGRMVNLIGSTRQGIVTKADADARAALDTLEARAADVTTLIPNEELAAIQGVVKQSQNPVTLARMARIMSDQNIIRESRNAPPSELRARINATNGNPGLAYPNVPPRVSNAINTAAERFGVSASYLGGMVTREYGQYLGGRRASGKPEYAPRAVHGNVDLRNVRSDVADAAAVAGELFGQPLNITSGYRSQARQDAIRASGNPNRVTVAKDSNHTHGTGLDISTADMAPADKGRLVGALVDAGFTGIGEYDTHIHADFRGAVPASFGDRGGKVWGGWTHLSPEVAQALKQRGFAAGLSADQIRRAAPVAYADDIDYGKGTQLTKDDGRPASSAVGVAQFTSGTFLEIMKMPGVAERIGVKLDGMSDEQILELRKDPDVSIMAAAALASHRKRTVEQTIGRKVSDAEVYMSHVLGAGGAITLLKSMDQRPDANAAAILPQAAASNRPLFYRNGKPMSVREVYGRFVRDFSAEPTRVAHANNETRQRFLQHAEKRLAEDPVAFAQETGTFNVTPIDAADGFATRGQEARAIADYYSIPAGEIKPFTEDEANSLKKAMVEGGVDDVLQIMSAVEAMGGDVARAALKQLDQKDSVYAYAAGLQFERGQAAVAGDIVRGQKRIEENPAIKDSIGVEQQDLYNAFVQATGGALFEATPSQRQAIQDAAVAHYVETVVARGRATSFDQDLFDASVQAVLGGTRDGKVVDYVNGELTVLPHGLDADTLETAMRNMTIVDWSEMSLTGMPPRYVDGELLDPGDLADEAKLRAIGNGQYKVQLDDGQYAVTGAVQGGRMEAFVFTPDPDKLRKISTRSDIGGIQYEEGDLPPADTGGGIRSLLMGE